MPRMSAENRVKAAERLQLHRQRKWTDEDRELLRDVLKKGATLQELADANGVSRQRIAQLVGSVRPMKEWNKTYSVYLGVDSWMKFHRITYAMLNDMLGYGASSSAQVNLADRLMGKRELRKTFIDALLDVTGMTYEEAFRKE